MERRRIWLVVTAVAMFGLAACGALPGDEGQPTVAIISPASGSTVPVNEPVTVQVQANDPNGPGVFRVDLMVDNVTVNSFEAAAPQASLAAELAFTPTTEGAVTVSAMAFRQDGTASTPATIALQVVGVTTESPPPSESESESEDESSSSDGEPPPPPEPSEARAAATANLDIPIREQCGPGCPQIGVWQEGDEGDFLIRTTSPTDYWYWTDYLGENQLGCVYQGDEQINFSLMEPDDDLPREPEQGCLYCGDGICSEEIGEVCDECTADCGVCPFCGDGEVNQDSEQCDLGGCGDGFFCNTSCQCEEVPVEEPECGNGIVEPGEQCDGDASACAGILLQTCTAICTCEPLQVAFCGDGTCQAGIGEDTCTCPEDCGIGCIK